MNELENAAFSSAKELSEEILAWAKRHNLLTGVGIEDAVEETDGGLEVPGGEFRAQATEEVLRKRAINLVTFDEDAKKVTIFTHSKVTKGDEKVLPFEIGGFSIDYRQGGVAQVKGNPPQPTTPLPYHIHNGAYCCGSSIYPAHCIGAGTLGAVVRDRAGVLFGLTNNHVSGACNNAMPGLPILAPGPLDCTEDACDPFTIGRHKRLLPINDGIPENVDISVNWDVSLIELANPALVSSMQGSRFDTPQSVTSPVAGMKVAKVGRTTGFTIGEVIGQSSSPAPVNYFIPEYGVKKKVFFEKVFVVSGMLGAFSRSGDSGSLVVTYDQGRAEHSVGIVFAGDEQRNLSFVLPLPEILLKLDVEIVTAHNV